MSLDYTKTLAYFSLMYESIKIVFRPHEGVLRESIEIYKPDVITCEHGILSITRGTLLQLFPLDTVREAVIVLEEKP